jgi:hypothetical protein
VTYRHDNPEFEHLLAAHASGELDASDRGTLLRLADAAPERAGDLEAIDSALAAFSAERRLRQQVLAPAEVREEADACYARLQRAAARVEGEIRDRAVAGGIPQRVSAAPAPARRARVWSFAFAVAAVVLLGVFLWLQRGPALSSATPNDDRLGSVPTLQLRPQIGDQASSVEWQAWPGATRYEVVIEDGEGASVLSRPAADARSTRWELSSAEVASLREHKQLFLRVVARDSIGLVVASSHDVPMDVR